MNNSPKPAKIVIMDDGTEWPIYEGFAPSEFKHRPSGPKVKDFYEEAVTAGVKLMNEEPSITSTAAARRCVYLTTNIHSDDDSRVRELARRIRVARKAERSTA